MAGPLRVTLYERDGCHLCDEARVLLDEVIGMDRYARVNVDADDDLVLRYGFRVPVIALDGLDRLEAPITAPDLRSLLSELEGPPRQTGAPRIPSRSPRSESGGRPDRG
jgi:hypothetical protein